MVKAGGTMAESKKDGLKELTEMTEEFGGYKKEKEMLKPCPECDAETQGTWIRIDQEDIWHTGCTKCSWQP